mgnify:CR=1 FL=1
MSAESFPETQQSLRHLMGEVTARERAIELRQLARRIALAESVAGGCSREQRGQIIAELLTLTRDPFAMRVAQTIYRQHEAGETHGGPHDENTK